MTCIAAWMEKRARKTTIWMGGDSAGSSGYHVELRKDPKVFKVWTGTPEHARREPLLIGYTSSFRMGQLLRYKLQLPLRDPDQDPYDYMVEQFVDEVRKVLKVGGYAQNDQGQESGGTFLVGFADRLFSIESDFQVAENLDPFTACGCGLYYALGALEAIRPDPSYNGEQRVRKALEVAEKYNGAVKGPFVIESI